MRVLLVEDDADMRALLELSLTARGHSVTACADGESGWYACQNEPFPLVFLDWLLPDMDGLDLCRKIRVLGDEHESVILMITVRTSPGDLEQVLDAGADDYIAKPFTPELLGIRTTIAERLVEQRQTHSRSLTHISALIEAVPDFICFKDRDGRWLSINSAAKRTFQLEDVSWQGRIDLELIELYPHLEDALLACRDTDDIAWQKGSYHDYEQTIVGANGEPYAYSIRKVPLYDSNGNRRGMLITGRDITETQNTFERIVEAKEMAEQASMAKSQFLGRMSHELRTPLNAILGFAQVIEIQPDDTLLMDVRDQVREIVSSGWYLVRIINDLLDLAAIEADKLEMQMKTVELDVSIDDCIKVMTPLAKDRQIMLHGLSETCRGLSIMADSFRFKQVMLNLLSNAVKYNRQGGEIRVRCERVAPDQVRISVDDNGSGIPEADLPRIFEAFARLEKRAYDVEGAGIGLSIAKHLVERMGGRVGVETVEGKGSTFWVELAQAASATARDKNKPGEQEQTTPESARAITVLYIEDSPSHVTLMETIIRNIGNIELLTAHTPLLGLELANAHRPDIILSDICLPGMDGYELLEKLKSNSRTSNIPVIAISANAMADEIKAGMRAGFRRYFTKPIHVAEFRKALRELLENERDCDNDS